MKTFSAFVGALLAAEVCFGTIQLPLGSAMTENASSMATARRLLSTYPLIDGHVDLPHVMRNLVKRPLDLVPQFKDGIAGHVDLPKLRKGGVAGLFHAVWVPCQSTVATGSQFLSPTNSAEDALESIDLIHRLVEENSDDMMLCLTADDVRTAFKLDKVSSLIGMEGSHYLMNSLALMRLYAQLGVRYLTLTHTCHTSFASSAGDGSPIQPIHSGNGLSEFGKTLIPELNRLGVMVDLSHVSDETAEDALKLSTAPVIFSHSGARSVHNHPRNVPDSILRKIGSGPNQNAGIVMSVFYPAFVDPVNATVARVADHIEHIAKLCGKAHVGISSDFDGMASSVEGLEDASQFPNLIIELIKRKWSESEIAGAMGGNLLRVMEEVERVKEQLAGEVASRSVYELRRDLPAIWGGPGGSYLPEDVRVAVARMSSRSKDEL